MELPVGGTDFFRAQLLSSYFFGQFPDVFSSHPKGPDTSFPLYAVLRPPLRRAPCLADPRKPGRLVSFSDAVLFFF